MGDGMAEHERPLPDVRHWRETVKALGAGDAVDQQQVKMRAKANIEQAHHDIVRLLCILDQVLANSSKRVNRWYEEEDAGCVDQIRERYCDV